MVTTQPVGMVLDFFFFGADKKWFGRDVARGDLSSTKES